MKFTLNSNPTSEGGDKNHVHILCHLSRRITQSKLLKEIKKHALIWIKRKGIKYQIFY